MKECWDFIKKQSTTVKVKMAIALIPSVFLYGVYCMGKFAENLDSEICRWVYRERR